MAIYFLHCPVKSLWSLSSGRGVLRLKTFSKMLFPGMSLGWMAGEKELIDAGLMLKKSAENNVIYVAGRPFHCNGKGWNTLRLNYSFPNLNQTETGIRSLGGTIKEELHKESNLNSNICR
jgi:DNA-binding transcriptional MocR family regulator